MDRPAFLSVFSTVMANKKHKKPAVGQAERLVLSKQTNQSTTLCGGSLGSCVDEERS